MVGDWGICTIFVTDRLADCYGGLLVRVVQAHGLCKLDAEAVSCQRRPHLPCSQEDCSVVLPVSDQTGELRMALVASQQLDRICGHCMYMWMM